MYRKIGLIVFMLIVIQGCYEDEVDCNSNPEKCYFGNPFSTSKATLFVNTSDLGAVIFDSLKVKLYLEYPYWESTSWKEEFWITKDDLAIY